MTNQARRIPVALLAAVLGVVLISCGSGQPSGEKLLSSRCQHCHTPELATSVSKSRDGWAITIDRMIARGAVLDEAEREILIDYLAEYQP